LLFSQIARDSTLFSVFSCNFFSISDLKAYNGVFLLCVITSIAMYLLSFLFILSAIVLGVHHTILDSQTFVYVLIILFFI
jgi:hypothetical protein